MNRKLPIFVGNPKNSSQASEVKVIPYATLLENYLSLPSHLRKVYLYLLRNEKAPFYQIVKDCRMTQRETQKILEQLIEIGFVHSASKAPLQKSTFYIPRRREIPQIKFDFSWKGFLGSLYIPPIFHYNLLSDSSRLLGFKKVIEKVVKKDDVVVDLGTGTGILALLASKKAKRVYAVEINPFILEATREIIKRYPESSKIELIEADAKTLKLKEKVDVVICEMIDTALISEEQVPVMNHAVATILKEKGRVIPLKALTYMELVKSDYEFCGYRFQIPFYEEYGARKVVDVLTDKYLLHSIRFDRVNPTFINKEVKIKIRKSGIINSFRLTTYVYGDERTVIPPSPWFNPPLVFPLINREGKEGFEVKKGMEVKLYIMYELGLGLSGVSYSLYLPSRR